MGVNQESISITLRSDGLVIGQHNISPYGIPGSRASFEGVIVDDIAAVIATAQYQDQTWREQRLYQLRDNVLYVGYQSVDIPRYKNDEGVYMYEDLNEIIFETDDFYLQRVDCSEL